MLTSTVSPSSVLAGDERRRKARRALFVFTIALPLTVALYLFGGHLWGLVASLEGVLFGVVALTFGLAIAFLPFVTLAFGWFAVWNGVESVWKERSRKTPIVDKLLIAIALLVFFAPALTFGGMALGAIVNGAVSFRRPVAREYLLATDPIAFWQGVGFLLIVAAALAWPAMHYWRNRLIKARS